MNVTGKTILVTGGGSGMGRELVLQLLKKGARVAALDINETTLQETAKLASDYSSQLSTYIVNITDRDAVLTLPEQIIKIHGEIDGIINNAGIIQRFVHINDLDFKELERIININFWGAVNLTKVFLPYLLKRPEAHIVNISSMGGFVPFPGQTAYGASKAAIKLFTEGLHSELLNTKVHVSIVFPGAIATNITANSGVASVMEMMKKAPKIKMTTASRAAQLIISGIEKNKSRILVGIDAWGMDILYRMMPEGSARIISHQMQSLLFEKN